MDYVRQNPGRIVATFGAGAVLAVLGCTQVFTEPPIQSPMPSKQKIRVGFVAVGPATDAGFNESHSMACQHLEDAIKSDVAPTFVENVPESAEVGRVMEKLIAEDHKLIFATSYGYLDPALKIAERHPDVRFMHCGGHKRSENLGTYSAYIHEAVYVTGIVAGRETKTNRLGFVAANSIPQVYWSINAFTLGVRSVNPNATVTVIFTNSWNDAALEAEAAEALIALGADVLAMHLDSPKTVVMTAEKHGKFSVGIHWDVHSFAPKGWLTGAVWHWDDFYRDTITSVQDGSWKSQNNQRGLKDGVVSLAPFGQAVEQPIRMEALAVRDRIADGEFVVFQGPINDKDGLERLGAGKFPDESWLGAMDWFVSGVNGTARPR